MVPVRTGDGAGDLVVEDQSASVEQGQDRIFALDGVTGETLWSKSAWLSSTIADVDGDGSRDVVGRRIQGDKAVFEASDASGAVVRRVFGAATRDGVKPAAGYLGAAGDLDGDGVEDHVVQFLWERAGAPSASEQRAVSIRTGGTLMRPTYATFVRASIDRAGDDAVEVTYGASSTTVVARDVRGRKLWSNTMRVADGYVDCMLRCAADLDGDGRAEVLVRSPGHLTVLAGRDGRVRRRI